MVLDGHLEGKEQLVLRLDEVHLRLRRDQLGERRPGELGGLAGDAAGAQGAALLVQLLALPKVMRSMPSSSRAPRVTRPRSERGSEISRL